MFFGQDDKAKMPVGNKVPIATGVITGTYRDILYPGMGPYPNVDMCCKVL